MESPLRRRRPPRRLQEEAEEIRALSKVGRHISIGTLWGTWENISDK
jgi:hypothetical protein